MAIHAKHDGLGKEAYGCLFVEEELLNDSVTMCGDHIEKWVAMGEAPLAFLVPFCEKHYRDHSSYHLLTKAGQS
mgnify:CR=1 FL=1